jgi:hypothetical protein
MAIERSRRAVRFELVHLVLLLELSVILFFCLRPASDPDYGWHIANGSHVFDGRIFSGSDIYSWTSNGIWVAHEWLAEAVMYLIHVSAGPTGNSILFGILGVVSYAVLARMLRRHFDWRIVLIVLPISFLGSMRSIGVRPIMLELLYVSLLLAIIDAYAAGSLSRGRLFLVAFAGAVLWANTHGSFLLMPGLFAISALELRLARDDRWPSMAFAALISILSPLANPWGLSLFGFATQSVTSATTLARIQEWQSPVLTEALAIPILAQLALAAAGIGGSLFQMQRGRRKAGDFPPTLGMVRAVAFAILALKSGRHVILFGVAAAPMMAAGLMWIFDLLSRKTEFGREHGDPVIHDYRRALINLAAAALVCGGIARAAWKEISPAAQRAAVSRRYPVGLVSRLADTMTPSRRLLNEYGWGGFLIAQNILPVFIDGRSEVYGDAQLDRYASIIHLEPGWHETMNSLGVDIVLMPRGSPLSAALEENGWDLIAQDSVGVLLEKRPR